MNPKNYKQAIPEKDLILFDGVCNLCNHAVTFIIDRDRHHRFVFASLQSESGRFFLSQHQLGEDYLDSLVLIQDAKVYRKSTAALRIARQLSGLWPFCYAFIMLPPLIRDFFYDIVARFRYRLFGKRTECRVPTPELKAKFLEL